MNMMQYLMNAYYSPTNTEYLLMLIFECLKIILTVDIYTTTDISVKM